MGMTGSIVAKAVFQTDVLEHERRIDRSTLDVRIRWRRSRGCR